MNGCRTRSAVRTPAVVTSLPGSALTSRGTDMNVAMRGSDAARAFTTGWEAATATYVTPYTVSGLVVKMEMEVDESSNGGWAVDEVEMEMEVEVEESSRRGWVVDEVETSGNVRMLPRDRPIHCRCISTTFAGQASVSSPARSRSAYAVMRRNHWFRVRFSTTAPDRHDRPCAAAHQEGRVSHGWVLLTERA